MDKNLEKKIKSILMDSGCKECYLFGSQAKGNAKKDSDIDIGVIGLSPRQFFSVHSKLEEATQSTVDLVDFDEKPKFYTLLKNLGELKRIG